MKFIILTAFLFGFLSCFVSEIGILMQNNYNSKKNIHLIGMFNE